MALPVYGQGVPAIGKPLNRPGGGPAGREISAVDAHRDASGAADLADAPRDLGVLGEAEVREVGEELLDRDVQLEPGEVGAEAAVDAEAEREVAVLGTVDDDLV